MTSDQRTFTAHDSLLGWTFRAARSDDALACAPLIHASGIREFGFFVGAAPDAIVAFLHRAFRSHHGRFSWRRHRVAVTPDGTIVGVLAAHDGRQVGFDDLHIAWSLLRHFGVRHMAASVLRGRVLERELPPPARSQTQIAHCAIDARFQGTGVFSALFDDARRNGMIATGERDIVLDVLVTNARAAALYRRLGFIDVPRTRPVSRRLPPELESIRMRLRG